MGGEVLRVREVAELFDVDRSTIYDRVRRGEIPSVGLGSAIRIPRRWVDEQLGVDGTRTRGGGALTLVLADGQPERLLAMVESIAGITRTDADDQIVAAVRAAITGTREVVAS